MTTTHRALTFLGTLAAGAMIAASTIATAHAEPAHIDDGSGPISNARAQAQALEAARIAAQAYAECLARNHDNDTEVC